MLLGAIEKKRFNKLSNLSLDIANKIFDAIILPIPRIPLLMFGVFLKKMNLNIGIKRRQKKSPSEILQRLFLVQTGKPQILLVVQKWADFPLKL